MKYQLTQVLLSSLMTVQVCFGQLAFPDSICTIKTEPSNRLKGTRVFLTIPTSYKIRTRATSYLEFVKDSVTGLQVIEYINHNFYQVKHEFSTESFDLKNRDTWISKDVKVDSFDGIYYTGPFKTADTRATFLVFGDSSFAVAISGGFLKTDKVAEIEINTILKTTAFDKFLIVDPLEAANFRFDKSITGFKYVPSIGTNELTYTADGIIASLDDERHKSSFEVASYKSIDFENAKTIIKSKMEELTEFSNSIVRNSAHRNININGNTAYEMTMDEKGQFIAETKFYIVVIQKEQTAVLFWGVDRDGGKWIEKFKATAQSIIF